MSPEQNKAVARRFIEKLLNNMDMSLVDDLFAPSYVNHLVPGGRDGFRAFFANFGSAFPGLKWHFTVDRVMADGEYVMVRATMRHE